MGIITERCLEAFHPTHLPFTLTSASPVNMSQMTVNQWAGILVKVKPPRGVSHAN